jgi:hypothetical protein
MKLYSLYTSSHERLFNEWFLPTIGDEYDKKIEYVSASTGGAYLTEEWTRGVIAKSELIIAAIKECWGDIFLYSDCDITFYGCTKNELLKSIENKDIVCQQDDPSGQLCTGFFVARGNNATLDLWQRIRNALETERRDQLLFNRYIRRRHDISWGYLSRSFFGAGMGMPYGGSKLLLCKLGICKPQLWVPGVKLYLPDNVVIHHANWTIGIENKLSQLGYVKRLITAREN